MFCVWQVANDECKMSYSNQHCYYNSSHGLSNIDSYFYSVKYCTLSSIHWCTVASCILNLFVQDYFSMNNLVFENWTAMIQLMKELSTSYAYHSYWEHFRWIQSASWAVFVPIITLVYNIWSFPKFITKYSLSTATITLNLSCLFKVGSYINHFPAAKKKVTFILWWCLYVTIIFQKIDHTSLILVTSEIVWALHFTTFSDFCHGKKKKKKRMIGLLFNDLFLGFVVSVLL